MSTDLPETVVQAGLHSTHRCAVARGIYLTHTMMCLSLQSGMKHHKPTAAVVSGDCRTGRFVLSKLLEHGS